ncbi:MAG TPA: hypothetical protein P5280_15295 [Cyclobacteriaceae bacterium]|nr:hypothetical protein [Cyclobacteriaceae bacterium]
MNLTDLANGKTTEIAEEKPREEEQPQSTDKAVTIEELKQAWDEFAEQRKTQVGEYHILKQEFDFSNDVVTVQLSNAVEEPLLQAIRTPLTEFLRGRLSNKRLNVISVVKEVQNQKIAYTNKEKFDHLAEKNPILKELKDRLGLDTDF